MAKLPGVFDTSAPRSELPSTATVDYSGLANSLGNIGQAISRHDAHLDEEADKVAKTHLLQATEDYAIGRAKREAEYTGEDAGFPGQEIATFDETVRPYRDAPDLDPRVKRALNRRLDETRLQVSDSAIAFTAARQGQIEGQRRAAIETAQDNEVLTQIAVAASEATKGIYNSWDGKSAGLSTGVKAAYDGVIDPILKGLPEAQRLRIEAGIRAQGNSYFSSAMAQESKGQDAYVLNTANSAADTATNMVMSDPESYQAAGMLVDHAAAALPGPLQEAWRKAANEQLLMSRFGALIGQGKQAQVTAELAGADEKLSPENKSRVMAMLERDAARKTAADYAEQAGMESQMAAYLDSKATGSALPRPADGDIERLVGPKGLADFRRQEQLATDASVKVGDFGHLTEAQMNARISELQAKVAAGGKDYDINSAVLAAAIKTRDLQVQARAKDPAAWAMTTDGTASDPAKAPAYFFGQMTSATDPQARASAARTYVAATLARQTQAGIANPAILPVTAAKSMVAPLQAAKDEVARGDALLGIMSSVSVFGDKRGQVLAELGRAGLGSQDALVVAELSDNPAMARDYTTGAPAWKALKPKEQKGLSDKVASALGKFDATLTGGSALAGARNDRYEMVARVAAGYMAAGDKEDQAVRRASAEYAERYSFADSWRMPSHLAQQKAYTFRGDKKTGLAMVQMGAYFMTGQDIAKSDGQVLGKTPAEAHQKLNLVRRQGKWFTREDDGGLELRVPDPSSGRMQVVTDQSGQPFSFTWAQLITRAQADDWSAK